MSEPVAATFEDRIIAHLGLARAVASRTVDPRCTGADREDLLAWGVVGLVQAAHRYRVEQGAAFGASAAGRVGGRAPEALRARGPLGGPPGGASRAAGATNGARPPPYSEVSLEKVLESGREPQQQAPAPAGADPRWPGVL